MDGFQLWNLGFFSKRLRGYSVDETNVTNIQVLTSSRRYPWFHLAHDCIEAEALPTLFRHFPRSRRVGTGLGSCVNARQCQCNS
jgi:hypothetical protein